MAKKAEHGGSLSQDVFVRIETRSYGPWEIHRPQPSIAKLVEKGVFQGKVLDIGCGIGDNAVFIAKNSSNVDVTAIDMASRSLETAREKARQNNANVHFELVNIFDKSSSKMLKDHSFDIILDSAVFHTFSNTDRDRYVECLQHLIKPGGLYIQLVFSEKELKSGGPRHIKAADLYELFSLSSGWTIESIEDTFFEAVPGFALGTHGRAYLSLIRRNKNN